MPMHVNRTRSLLAVGILLAAAAAASAGIMEPALNITATNDNGTATYQVPLAAFSYDPLSGEYAYDRWTPMNLMNGASYVARLTGLHLYMVDDPALNARFIMNFGVEAGESLTTFTVAPGTISFPAIPADASAALMSWSFTLAENPNDGDSAAWLRGVGAGSPILNTYYNAATLFHNSVWELGAVGNGAVNTAYDNQPPVGFEDIPVAVNQMDLAVAFTLTPLDNVEIQGSYVFDVPEPSALGLFAAGVVLMAWRRR